MSSPRRRAGAAVAPIPVTILTGFLGSGKTTLLNHILAGGHGLRVGVLVNEFGSISIDDKLITGRSETVIELANGCVCCTMQGDLLAALRRLAEFAGGLDYVLLETTGLADPAPVAASLLADDVGGVFGLDGIVTVVDADNFDANLDHAEAAFHQLTNGDIILINKTDLVAAHIPGLIERNIRAINPTARFLACVMGRVDPSLLLGVDAVRDRLPSGDHAAGDRRSHHGKTAGGAELAEFNAVTFESERPFDGALFRAFLRQVPAAVYRGKGILHIAGDDCRRIFHLVGDRCVVTVGASWAAEERRRTELVLIGRQLDGDDLKGRLTSCLKEGAAVAREKPVRASATAAGARSDNKDMQA